MDSIQGIAGKRVDFLLQKAFDTYDSDSVLSKRYVVLARKIGMAHRVKIGNRRFCKKCFTIFKPGKTLKVRLDSKRKGVLYVCLNCNSIRKFVRS